MKKGKKILSLLLMITIIFSLIGCEKNSKTTKGGYIEEEINAPEDLAYAMDFRKCNDGTFVLVGTSLENKLLYYESKDLNEDWEKTEIPLPTEANCITQVNVSKISKDKEIFISYCFYNEDEMKKSEERNKDTNDYSSEILDNKYAIIDSNKNIKDLQLDYLNEKNEDGYLEYGNFLFEENIIAMSKENKVLVINKDNGKIESDFNVKGQHISNGAILDDSLVVVIDSTIRKYDLETGKDLGDIKTLKDENLANEIVYMAQGESKGILQYITENGLYKYDEKKDKVSEIIDSSLCSINDNSRRLTALVEIKNNEYIGLYDTYSDTGTIVASLVRYRYDESKKESPKNITIYGLYNTATVESSIAKYKNDHPELNIKFKVGIDSERDITVSDAIKTLNAEIVAGKGPDILILDGLPVDEYIEEDLLEDISDIIDEYSDNEEIIESIKDTYTSKDKIYQFPMYFDIPMIVGEKDVIKDINDLSSLVNSLEKVDKGTITTNGYAVINMITLVEEMQKDKLINKKGIDKEELKKYFENSKKVYDICKVAEDGDEDIEDSIDEYYLQILLSRYFDITDYLIVDSYNLNINLLTGVDSFAEVYSLQSIKEDISYKFLEDNDVFIPNTIIGINSNSKNKDEAKKIAKALFSKQCQAESLVLVGGFPTNRLLLEKLKAESKDGNEESWGMGDEQIEYKVKWPSKEEFEILDKKIESLNKPIKVNRKLFFSLIEGNRKYCNNEISLDEAVQYVIDNTDLDLAE